MPDTVILPFAALNEIPLVDGLENVRLEIPTIDEIGDAVAERTLGATQVDNIVVSASVEALDDWWTDFQILSQIVDGVASVVVEAVEGATGVDVPGDGSVIDEVIAETPQTDEIDELTRDIIQSEFDDIVLEGTDITFSGIFGPLAEDIADALGDIIDFDPDEFLDDIVAAIEEALGIDAPGDGPLLADIPTAGDISDAVADALDGLSPNLNGVEFWRNPLDFLEEAWHELKHLLLSPESAERLQQALDDRPNNRRGR